MSKDLKETLLAALAAWKKEQTAAEYDFDALLLFGGKVYELSGWADGDDRNYLTDWQKKGRVLEAGYPTYEPCLYPLWIGFRGPVWSEVPVEDKSR